MAGDTNIQWADKSWNPIVGCSVVSPGCTNCYAMKMAARLEKMLPTERRGDAILPSHYSALTEPSKAGPVWTGRIAKAPDHILTAPLRWRKPCKIFVNSMSDLFHETVPDTWIDRVFAIMALAPQHSFQVLTKRSARMRAYFEARREGDPWAEAADDIADMASIGHHPVVLEPKDIPLPNVWLGVSTEDQRRADERIPDLLATPAAVRFVSAEPLLGPINFRRLRIAPDHHTIIDALHGYISPESFSGGGFSRRRLNWVIVGGESGPGARPMHPDWARSIRDQCAASGVPFFMKQMSGPQKSRMPPIPDDLMVRQFPLGSRGI